MSVRQKRPIARMRSHDDNDDSKVVVGAGLTGLRPFSLYCNVLNVISG
jgi:hypothetical protein